MLWTLTYPKERYDLNEHDDDYLGGCVDSLLKYNLVSAWSRQTDFNYQV